MATGAELCLLLAAGTAPQRHTHPVTLGRTLFCGTLNKNIAASKVGAMLEGQLNPARISLGPPVATD